MDYNDIKMILPLMLKKDEDVCNGSGFSDTFSSSNEKPKQMKYVNDTVDKDLFHICRWHYKED